MEALVEEIAALVLELDEGAAGREDLVRRLAEIAAVRLASRLREGVAPGDCGGAFALAAARLALGELNAAGALEGVTSVTAGDMTLRREGKGGSRQEGERAALSLLAPYLRDGGFWFQGVPG